MNAIMDVVMMERTQAGYSNPLGWWAAIGPDHWELAVHPTFCGSLKLGRVDAAHIRGEHASEDLDCSLCVDTTSLESVARRSSKQA